MTTGMEMDLVQALRREAAATEELHPEDSEIAVMRAAADRLERVDEILGEFHGQMYDLSEQARKAKDGRAEAWTTYLHDQFCLVRNKIAGVQPERDLAKHPAFSQD